MAEQSLNFIVLNPADNVATARCTLKKGLKVLVSGSSIVLRQIIPGGHKMSLSSIKRGERLIKYGQIIGFAKKDITVGDWVHSHNVELKEVLRNYSLCEDYMPLKPFTHKAETFKGFARAGGKVGTRNYIGVISSVNCSASVSRYVADHFRDNNILKNYPNVDGVVAFTHKGGCSYDVKHGHKILQRVIAGMARHSNRGGYLLIGLGCEVNQVPDLIKNHQLDYL